MEEEIKLKDDSGDKEFFTIIPNYILNHSTHWDREVYVQMKRIAGDKASGKCYMSIPKLAKKCGMGKKRLIGCVKYLITQKWITYLGKIPVQTAGGKQLINAYKVNNIWKLNSDFYHKGGVSQGYPQEKGGVSQTPRVGSESPKGGVSQGREEEPLKKNPLKKNIAKTSFASIFSAYKEKINSKSLLTKLAEKKIASALKSFSEKDLLEMIAKKGGDDWFLKNNASRGISWFFSSKERLNRYLEETKVSENNEIEL